MHTLNVHWHIALAMSLGCLLDICFGDPPWLPHPVRGIGALIAWGESALRKVFPATKAGEFTGGALLALVVVAVSYAVPFALLLLARQVSPYAALALEAVFCYQLIAAKDLRSEALRIYGALAQGLIPARAALARVVGRDTDALDEPGVIRAAVETVAENTTDGVVAPLLFMALGGAPLAFAYKAVNTMDSMIGYRTPKYLYFGKAAARLDDVANFLPAVIAAHAMLLATLLLPGMHARNAARIYRRDRYNHKSPNSAKTEAVCAGALGIRLGGGAAYFGQWVDKPTIGDALRSAQRTDILKSCQLMLATGGVVWLLCLGVRICLAMV